MMADAPDERGVSPVANKDIINRKTMVSVDGLAVEFGGTTLFSDVSFVINDKDRIALMGKNGAGKSTLLKILAGVRNATRGSVSAPKDTVIAYLPQHLMTEDGRTVFEEASQAFDGTLICVSHDRDFLDGLVTKVYEFGHGKVREHLCGIYEFLAAKKMEELNELERN